MKRQRIYGIIILAFCAVIVAIASQGISVEERDCTAVLFLLPLGIYLLVTKEQVVYDFAPSIARRTEQEVGTVEHRKRSVRLHTGPEG